MAADASPPPFRVPLLLAGPVVLLAGLLAASATPVTGGTAAAVAAGRDLLSLRLPAAPDIDGPWAPDVGRWLYAVALAAGAHAPEIWLAAVRLVLAGLLALLLLGLARPSPAGPSSEAAAALAALLALVAVGPWLSLSPTLASLVLFALMLRLLARDEGRGGSVRAAWWPVPLVALVWAFVDASAVLAPAAVGLFALGRFTESGAGAGAGVGAGRRSLLLLLLACVLAALAGVGVDWLRGAPLTVLTGDDVSPLWPTSSAAAGYRSRPLAVSAAHALLVGIGVLALLRPGPARRWGPLGLGVLLLSLVRPAAAPFLAVVAVPVVAAGLSSVLERVARRDALVVLAGCLLVVAGWPGWLAGGSVGVRQPGARIDAGLREAVEVVARWRAEGRWPAAGRGLAFSPEPAGYQAWFAPAPRSLAGTDGRSPAQLDGAGWRDALRARRIDHVILHVDPASPRAHQDFARFAEAPDEFPLVFLRGRTAVFAWRDPAGGAPLEGPADLITSEPGARAVREAGVPAQPPRLARAPRWWRAFRDPAEHAGAWADLPDRDEAGLYLALFDARRPVTQARRQAAWAGVMAAGLGGGLSDGGRGSVPLGVDLAVRLAYIQGGWPAFAGARDDAPLVLPLLAVRAARRALGLAPDDARSQLLLGEAYLRLAEGTRERAWIAAVPVWGEIRQVQALTAFNQALVTQPGSSQAHGRLARLHRGRGELDLTLRHLDTLVDLTRAGGARPEESPEAFREGLAGLERERDDLAREVARRTAAAAERAESRRLVDLARDAVGRGLPGRALGLLLASDASEFGPEGTRLELDLLLGAGRLGDALEWATPELAASVGPAFYHELMARMGAARGDYAGALEALEATAERLAQPPYRGRSPGRAGSLLDGPALAAGRALLRAPLLDASPAALAQSALARGTLLDEARTAAARLRQVADVQLVRGLLALEAGDEAAARAALTRALSVSPSGPTPGRPSGARVVAEAALRWLDDSAP